MMFRALSVAVGLVISAHAYQVISPNSNRGWVSTGQNAVAWQRVDTDPTSFDLVLTNVNGSVFARSSQMLASDVDGTTGSLTIEVENLPPGPHYRVNLNAPGSGPNGQIFAQSNEFTIIRRSNTTSTSNTTTPTSTVTETSTSVILFTQTTPVITTDSETVTTTETDPVTLTTDATSTTTEFSTITETVTTETLTETATLTTSVFFGNATRKMARRAPPRKWLL